MEEAPWYRTIFGEEYLSVYRFPPERTARDVEAIVTLLDLPPGSRLLDLGCGHGRIAIPLAQHGYQVTGQDLCEYFLQRAEAEARAQGVHVEWVHGDMRELPFENTFDAVLNIFTSFGYLENEDEDQKVVDQVSRALKPGGLFLLDTVHRDTFIRRLRPYGIERFEDGRLLLREDTFDLLTSRGETRATIVYPDGRRTEYRHSVRHYTLRELARMMEAAGLCLEASYGGLDGSSLTLDSWRLAVVGRKPAAGEAR